MDWQTLRRTPWFRWGLSFAVFLIGSLAQGAHWNVAVAFSAGFAFAMTALFQYQDRRKR